MTDMPDVDEKVVRLRMDDGQFDKASDRTIKKLDELKKSLEFNGAVNSFNELDKAAKKVDMSPLEKGVTAVTRQFSAFEAIALGALMRIGQQAVDTGERLLKSLTIDNVSSGWSKYEQKVTAVQTIMSATAKQFTDTGEQMQFVEEQLEVLNWFTDETSFKFLDMVNNIGKFTNNNVELNKAVKAMEGISTWAASAGANTNEAGRAMYNLSQAIAVGSVKLIDWKSIENANMATAEFKQIAIETAQELGTLKQVSDDTWETLSGKNVSVANFNENLSEAWFTSEVLLETLDRYGGFADRLGQVVDETGIMTTTLLGYIDEYIDGTLDMQAAVDDTGLTADELQSILEELGSEEYELGRRAFKAAQETKTFTEAIDYVKEAVSSGWMQSFELIFGNYQEAKEMWSELAEVLYEVFVESGNIRNEMLRLWKDQGGRDRFIESAKTALSSLLKIINAVSDGFRSIFPKATVETLMNVTHGFELLVEALTPTETTLNTISSIVAGFASVLKVLIGVATAVIAGLDPLINTFNRLAGAIAYALGLISDNASASLADIFDREMLESIYQTVYKISSVLATIIEYIAMIAGGALQGIGTFVQNVMADFKAGEGGIIRFVMAVINNIKTLVSNFLNGGSSISGILNGLIEKVGEFVNSFNISGEGIGKFFSDLATSIKSSGIFEVLEAVIGAILSAISYIANGVSSIANSGVTLESVISFLADQLYFLWDWLKASLANMTPQDVAVLALVAGMMLLISELNNGAKALTKTITSLGTTFTKLGDTIASFANGNWLDNLSNSLKNLGKTTKYAQIALAIYTLVQGLLLLSEVPTDQLGVAVAAVAAVAGMMILFMAALQKLLTAIGSSGEGEGGGHSSKGLSRAALAMQQIAIGIGALSASVYLISQAFGPEHDWARLIASLGSVALLMTALVGVMAAVDKLNINVTKIGSLSASLIIFGVAIDTLAIAVALLAQFDPTKVFTAGLVVSGIIMAIGGMAALMQNTDWSPILAASATMISLAGAITIFAGAVAIMAAATNIPGFQEGMASMLAGLAILTGAMSAIIFVTGAAGATSGQLLSLSVAMIAFAAAIDLLAVAVIGLSVVPFQSLATAASVFLAAILGFTAIAFVANATVPGLLALSAVLLSLGASFLMIAGAVALLVDAALKVSAFVAALMIASEVLGVDLPQKIHEGFATLELILRDFLVMIRNLAPEFALTFGALVIAAIEAIILAVNAKKVAMIQAVMTLILAVLELLARLGPPIIDALIRTIEGLTQGLPRLLAAIGDFIEELFAGIGVIVNSALKGLTRGIFNIFGIDIQKGLDETGDNVKTTVQSDMNDINNTVATGMDGVANNVHAGMADTSQAFKVGGEDAKATANEVFHDIGDEGIEGLRDSWDWHSPLGVVIQAMHDCGSAMEIGADQISGTVYNAGTSVADTFVAGFSNNLFAGTEDTMNIFSQMFNFGEYSGWSWSSGGGSTRNLGMNPGSEAGAAEVRKALETVPEESEAEESGEETAEEWWGGFETGMTTGGSTTMPTITEEVKEEVEEASEEIGDTYTAAIEEINRQAKKEEYEYDIWEGINRSADKAELTAAKIAYTARKISYQNDRLNAAVTQYNALVEAYGEDSVEARDAYLTVLQQQKDLVDLQNELADLQNEHVDNEQELLDRMAGVREQRELEYQLWQAQNPNATEAEKQLMEQQRLSTQLEEATEDLILAQDNYTKAVERYGEGSQEAQAAWNEYLRAAIEQANLQNKLTDSTTSSAEQMRLGFERIAQWYRDNNETYQSLLDMGFSPEEIAASLRSQFGLPELAEAQAEMEQAATENAEQVYNKYGMTMIAGMQALEPAFAQEGTAYTTTVADAMMAEEPMEYLVDATNVVVTTALETANSEDNIEAWRVTGDEIINGLIVGLKRREGALYDAIEQIIAQALAVARSAAGVKSPSRETMWIAEMMDKGLSIGLIKYAPTAISAAAKLMNQVVDTFTDVGTSNMLEFAGRLVAGGIANGFDDYSSQVLSMSQGMIERMSEQVESELPELNSRVISQLKEWGYSVEDLDFEFVMSLNTDKAWEDMTDFERAVLSYRNLGLRASGYEGEPISKEDFAKIRGIERMKQSSIDREYEEYLLDRQESYMAALTEFLEAERLISQTIARFLNTAKDFTEGVEEMRGEKTYNYTQNIYSQKPLSTLDVYRNTNKALQALS